jgi:hypothetical protein
MKLCNKCHQQKEYSEFTKNKNSKDKLSYTCRTCNIILAGEWRKNNYEKAKQCQNKFNARYRIKGGIGVYGLWNKIDECWDYIGEGALNDRETKHRRACLQSTPDEVKLNIWFEGFDNIYEFRVLYKCDSKQQCRDTETEYIDKLNPRYNTKKRKKCEK